MKDEVKVHELLDFRSSGIHGLGAYAKVAIPEGTRIIEYVGEKITKEESAKRCEADNVYIFTVDDKWDIDGDVGWNPAKYVNHSCSPNCETRSTRGRIWFFALRDIKPGEEITFNYSYGIEDYEEHPCECGAPNCVGYIVAEEFFLRFKNKKLVPELETLQK